MINYDDNCHGDEELLEDDMFDQESDDGDMSSELAKEFETLCKQVQPQIEAKLSDARKALMNCPLRQELVLHRSCPAGENCVISLESSLTWMVGIHQAAVNN